MIDDNDLVSNIDNQWYVLLWNVFWESDYIFYIGAFNKVSEINYHD